MSSPPPAPYAPDAAAPTTPPRVLAILVSRDGEESVAAALRTRAAQRYPRLDVVAVDNASTDRTADVLTRRLGAERVIHSERNVGFGRAIALALRSEAVAEDVDYVLCVHDDLALMPDAVQWLVDAMETDPTLSVVGPKLREWDEEPLLQQVGMSADVFLRAESQLDPGELDQGQQDGRGDVLYVSTAGMLVRREVFARLGGFDARFDAFRDDLDLCWRVWIAGRRVAVVPAAVGYHVGAAASGARPDLDLAESRYRTERHAIASMLKNYSGRRLAWVLPLSALVNLARMVALVIARRFGEAFAVVRAYAWNLGQLPGTLRRRRVVQATRRLPDSRLSALFTPGLPRLRQYADSLLESLAGGSTRALVDAEDVSRVGVDPLADQPIQRFLRDRPLVLLGVPLLIAFALSVTGFLDSGAIVGGEVAPWPDSPMAFLSSYLSGWSGDPLASASAPSPIQAVLGLLSGLLAGSAWLAQRVLVFGIVPLAFTTTLRAGRLVTNQPWPRVVGAAIYVLSPAVLGTLAEGRYGLAIVAGLLPAVVSLTITTVDPRTAPGVAWRSTALLSLAVVLSLGADPIEGLLVPVIIVVALVVAVLRGWVRPFVRLAVGAVGAVLILSPWLVDLVRDGGPGAGTLASGAGAPAVDIPLWRALTGQPQIVDGLDGVIGWGMVAIPAAVLLGALVVGMRARPLITASLVLLVVTSGGLAWATGYYDVPFVHPPALLLPGAVGLAVLGMITARWSTETLTAADFGVAQVGTAVAGIVLVGGVVAGLGLLANGPWTELSQDPQLVPAFIGADAEQVGEYRVLLVDRAEDGAVSWEVVGDQGPVMTSFGTLRDAALSDVIADALAQIDEGVSTEAAAVLGVLNVRYVVLLTPEPALRTALSRQVDLEPLPSTAAVSYQVRTWLPRAAVIGEPAAGRLLATGDPGPTRDVDVQALDPRSPSAYVGQVGPATGALVVSEAGSSAWRAVVGGMDLERVLDDPVNAYAVAVDEPVTAQASVSTGFALRRRVVVALQVLVVLAIISLAVRPPGARVRPERSTSLPTDLVGLADTTTSFPRIDPDAAPPGTTRGGGP